MSVPATGILVNRGTTSSPNLQDLNTIFRAYSGGDKAVATGITVPPNGQDLNALFDPIGGCTGVTGTNILTNSRDLSELFAPIGCTGSAGPTGSTGSTGSISYDCSNNNVGLYTSSYYPFTGLLFYIPFGSPGVINGQLNNTITFNKTVNAVITVVGGGAGGGTLNSLTYSSSTTAPNWAGCGGGGGGAFTLPFTFVAGVTYPFGIGQGGFGGGTNNTIQSSGYASYFGTSITDTNAPIYVAGGGTVTSPSPSTGTKIAAEVGHIY